LHNHDTTYEEIVDFCIRYQTRYAQKDYIKSKTYNGILGEAAKARVLSPISRIILLSKEIIIDMTYMISIFKDSNWKKYLPALKECYLDFIQRPENDINRQWNLPALKALLQEWEPDFL